MAENSAAKLLKFNIPVQNSADYKPPLKGSPIAGGWVKYIDFMGNDPQNAKNYKDWAFTLPHAAVGSCSPNASGRYPPKYGKERGNDALGSYTPGGYSR